MAGRRTGGPTRSGAARPAPARSPGRRRSRQPSRAARRFPAARLSIAFGLVIVLAIGLLAAVGLSSVADRDWHAAVTIDGSAVGRADVRNRTAVLEALSVARAGALTDLWLAGGVSAIEREALAAGLGLADPLTATVDDLVRERAIRDEAAAAGIAAPAVDPWAELAAAAVQPVARHIRWVVITAPAGATPDGTPAEGWPLAPTGGPTSPEALAARDAASRKAAGLLPTTRAADVVAAAVSAGWTVRGEDGWIADRGPAAGIPDVLVAALRDPALVDGAAVGPIADEASAGLVIGILRGHGLPPVAAMVAAWDPQEGRRTDTVEGERRLSTFTPGAGWRPEAA